MSTYYNTIGSPSSYHSNTSTYGARSSLPPRRMLNQNHHLPRGQSFASDSSSSPHSTFSVSRSSRSNSIGCDYKSTISPFQRPSAPLYPLYQSSTRAYDHDGAIDAKVMSPRLSNIRALDIKVSPKTVTFAPRKFVDGRPVLVMSPRNASNSSSNTNTSNNTISTCTPTSTSSLASYSGTASISNSYRGVIIQRRNDQNHMTQKLKLCTNMVNNKCRCKHILPQNSAAQRIWSACYRMRINNKRYKMDDREIEIAYFDGLYNGLCKYMKQEIDSDRVPTKRDISDVIQRFGGFALENGEVVMDRCHFLTFWKWFRGSCQILKDVYNLWDTKYPFQLNLFMNRKQCEQILNSSSYGTFLVRLSSRQNALVVSYSEPVFDRTTKIRHILLIRKSKNNYMAKTNRNSHKCSAINKLIRAFAKLQYIYTPNCIYKKNHVF